MQNWQNNHQSLYIAYQDNFKDHFDAFCNQEDVEVGSDEWCEYWGGFVECAQRLYDAVYPDDNPQNGPEIASVLEAMGDAIIAIEG